MRNNGGVRYRIVDDNDVCIVTEPDGKCSHYLTEQQAVAVKHALSIGQGSIKAVWVQ